MQRQSIQLQRTGGSFSAIGAASLSVLVSSCVFDLPPLLDDSDASLVVPPTTIPTEPEPEPSPEPVLDSATPIREGGSGADGGREPEDASAGGSRGEGDSGDSGSGKGGNGAGGGGSFPSCEDGERECDGACIAVGQPCCEGGCELNNALSECVDDQCVIDACDDGFVDCDGEPSNGCEADFNFDEVSAVTLPVSHFDVTASNPWASIPMHPIVEPCIDCGQSEPRVPHPEPLNQGARSPSEGLAGFSLAWDSQALHLRVRVFDDDITTEAGELELIARAYDNVEFVFDGDEGSENGAQDRLIFIGFDGALYELDGKDEGQTVDVDAPEVEARCFTLTAHFTKAFLTNNDPGLIELAAGAAFQVNVGINDYDGSPNTELPELPFEHTAHLFFRDPNANYWFGMRELPRVELSP